MIDLDCSSPESTRSSVARLLNMTAVQVSDLIKSLVIPFSEEPLNFIKSHVDGLGGPPITVAWFHASRVTDPEDFRRHGIRTKSTSRPFIETMLQELSTGLTKQGVYPNALSVAFKGIHDEGPFAFLIDTVARSAPGSVHAYTEAPELVEDIAGKMLAGNYQLLVDRFRQVTKPCIVKFKSVEEHRREGLLGRAIWYLHLLETGEPEHDAAEVAHTCFDGHGRSVPHIRCVECRITTVAMISLPSLASDSLVANRGDRSEVEYCPSPRRRASECSRACSRSCARRE